MVEIFHKFKRRYGAIRIRNELKKSGIKASRKRISKAMKKYNLIAKATKKFVITTNSRHNLPISPNLLMRAFNVIAPNTVWACDFTYINTIVGWRYLAVVIDLFDRSVVGWTLADNMKKAAVKKHGRKNGHYIVGKQIVPCDKRGGKFPGNEAVIGVEHCARRGMEHEVLPEKNNDIYKDYARCYNGKGAGWDIVL